MILELVLALTAIGYIAIGLDKAVEIDNYVVDENECNKLVINLVLQDYDSYTHCVPECARDNLDEFLDSYRIKLTAAEKKYIKKIVNKYFKQIDDEYQFGSFVAPKNK